MALLQAANRRIGPLTSALLRAHDIGEQIRSWLVVRRQLRGANCHPPLLPLQVWHPPLLPGLQIVAEAALQLYSADVETSP